MYLNMLYTLWIDGLVGWWAGFEGVRDHRLEALWMICCLSKAET